AGGGPRLPSCQKGAGGVLSPRPGALWRPQGGGGDGAEDRRAGVSAVEIRRGVGAPGDGGGRGGLPSAGWQRAGAESHGVGLSIGPGHPLTGEGAAAPPGGSAPNNPRTLVRVVAARPARGGGGRQPGRPDKHVSPLSHHASPRNVPWESDLA